MASSKSAREKRLCAMSTFNVQWSSWREAILGWIYPNWCHLCDAEPADATVGFVGENCRAEVKAVVAPFCRRCGLPFDGAILSEFECTDCREAAFDFEFARASVVAGRTVREALHHYKYHRALWIEPCLTRWLLDQALPVLRDQGWTSLVPVPLHPVRQREREFNQASRLARILGNALSLPVQERWVVRQHPTQSQTRLNRSARAANVRNAFSAVPNASAQDESVIVIDDILTTGATTQAVSRILRGIGARRVCVWTLARAVG